MSMLTMQRIIQKRGEEEMATETTKDQQALDTCCYCCSTKSRGRFLSHTIPSNTTK
jgi:hypothetical protein